MLQLEVVVDLPTCAKSLPVHIQRVGTGSQLAGYLCENPSRLSVDHAFMSDTLSSHNLLLGGSVPACGIVAYVCESWTGGLTAGEDIRDRLVILSKINAVAL